MTKKIGMWEAGKLYMLRDGRVMMITDLDGEPGTIFPIRGKITSEPMGRYWHIDGEYPQDSSLDIISSL